MLPEERQQDVKVKYTIHITRAVFSEETFELYKKYEKAVHDKDREEATFKRSYCNSPIYDPDYDLEFAETPMEPTFEKLDLVRNFDLSD